MDHEDAIVCRIRCSYFKGGWWRIYQELVVYENQCCRVTRPPDPWSTGAIDDLIDLPESLLNMVRSDLRKREFFRLENGIPILKYGLLDSKTIRMLPRGVKDLLRYVDRRCGVSDAV